MLALCFALRTMTPWMLPWVGTTAEPAGTAAAAKGGVGSGETATGNRETAGTAKGGVGSGATATGKNTNTGTTSRRGGSGSKGNNKNKIGRRTTRSSIAGKQDGGGGGQGTRMMVEARRETDKFGALKKRLTSCSWMDSLPTKEWSAGVWLDSKFRAGITTRHGVDFMLAGQVGLVGDRGVFFDMYEEVTTLSATRVTSVRQWRLGERVSVAPEFTRDAIEPIFFGGVVVVVEGKKTAGNVVVRLVLVTGDSSPCYDRKLYPTGAVLASPMPCDDHGAAIDRATSFLDFYMRRSAFDVKKDAFVAPGSLSSSTTTPATAAGAARRGAGAAGKKRKGSGGSGRGQRRKKKGSGVLDGGDDDRSGGDAILRSPPPRSLNFNAVRVIVLLVLIRMAHFACVGWCAG